MLGYPHGLRWIRLVDRDRQAQVRFIRVRRFRRARARLVTEVWVVVEAFRDVVSDELTELHQQQVVRCREFGMGVQHSMGDVANRRETVC